MRRSFSWAVSAFAVAAACGPSAPVAWPERTQPWLGSRKRTLTAGETALKEAMGRVKRVQTPGNEEPVLVDGNCVNGAWFTLPGSPKGQLGETFQYSWHLCVTDEQQLTVQVNCLEVVKTEKATDSHECGQGRIAKDVASRTDELLEKMKSAK